MCVAHTNEPASVAPPEAQQANAEAETQKLLGEIEAGFQDLRLNAGQQKEYAMKVLALKAAPNLQKLTAEQLRTLLQAITDDLW